MGVEDIRAQILQQVFSGHSAQSLPDSEVAARRLILVALMREHDIAWDEVPDLPLLDSHGCTAERRIRTPPLSSELTYWVTLHEVGHFALSLPSHRSVDGAEERLYLNEATVWEWAIRVSPLPPSADAVAKIQLTLRFFDDPGPGREEAQHRVAAALAKFESPRP